MDTGVLLFDHNKVNQSDSSLRSIDLAGVEGDVFVMLHRRRGADELEGEQEIIVSVCYHVVTASQALGYLGGNFDGRVKVHHSLRASWRNRPMSRGRHFDTVLP